MKLRLRTIHIIILAVFTLSIILVVVLVNNRMDDVSVDEGESESGSRQLPAGFENDEVARLPEADLLETDNYKNMNTAAQNAWGKLHTYDIDKRTDEYLRLKQGEERIYLSGEVLAVDVENYSLSIDEGEFVLRFSYTEESACNYYEDEYPSGECDLSIDDLENQIVDIIVYPDGNIEALDIYHNE